MKIYISGPIAGQENYLERFRLAEQILTAAGHEVINPARVGAQLPRGTTHKEYMKLSIACLKMCDTVFFLKGWEHSSGARQEFWYAVMKGYTMTFEGGKDGEEQAGESQGILSKSAGRDLQAGRKVMHLLSDGLPHRRHPVAQRGNKSVMPKRS